MAIALSAPRATELKPRIVVFGVGGAGGNAVNNMIEAHLEGVEFVVANTDAQQLAFAKLRAIEHNRYVVVAATTGISSVIGPDGRELARTGFFEPGYLDTPVRLMTGLTPATRWGPVVQCLLISIGIFACIAAIILRRSPRISLRRRTPRTDTPPPAMAPRRR